MVVFSAVGSELPYVVQAASALAGYVLWLLGVARLLLLLLGQIVIDPPHPLFQQGALVAAGADPSVATLNKHFRQPSRAFGLVPGRLTR